MLGFCFFTGAARPLALGLDREKEDKETCGFLPCSLTVCCSSQALAGFFFSEPENCSEAAPGRPKSGAASRIPWLGDPGEAGLHPRAKDELAARGMQAGARSLSGYQGCVTGSYHRPKCFCATVGTLLMPGGFFFSFTFMHLLCVLSACCSAPPHPSRCIRKN